MFVKKKLPIVGSRILILGFAYKENTSDYRNTKVIDVYNELKSLGLEVDIYDPIVSKDEVREQYKIDLISDFNTNSYQLILKLVKHIIFTDKITNLFDIEF